MIVTKNKIQTTFLIVSFITFITQFIILCVAGYKRELFLVLFCPIILMLGLFILENVKKNCKWLQTILIILYISIIIFLQFTICSIVLIGYLSQSKEMNTLSYRTTSTAVYYNIRSKHKRILKTFPKEIPADAKNIEFYFDLNSYFGGCAAKLKFSTNELFLNSEIDKNKYIRIEGPYNNINFYKFSYARNWIFNGKPNSKEIFVNYKIYVIGDNTMDSSCHSSCEYGIAVNEKTNTILYYYSNPD